MFLLAASSVRFDPGSQVPLTASLTRVEEQARNSCLSIVGEKGKLIGLAVCLSDQGQFVAPKSISDRKKIEGITQTGTRIDLKRTAVDTVSGLVILEVVGKLPAGIVPAELANSGENAGEKVLLLLPNQAVQATIIGNNEIAYNPSDRTAIPLDQVQILAPVQNLESGFLFDESGRLQGLLSAGIPIQETISGGMGTMPNPLDNTVTIHQFSPQTLITAYSPSAAYFARVVQGLMSPNHHVPHPMLGLECRAVPQDRGAVVVSVFPGSPAETAGIEVGDVITQFGLQPVRTPVDYLRALIDQTIGDPVSIILNRQGEVIKLNVVLIDGSMKGQAKGKESLMPSIARSSRF